MKISHLLLVLCLSAVAGYLGASFTSSPATAPAPEVKETAWERVQRTGILRCGYASVGPQINKNPKTGIVEGYAPRIVEAVADELGLKVEWTRETGLADFAEGLAHAHYDAFCALSVSPQRTRVSLFTRPMFEANFYLYGRAGHELPDTIAALNDPKYTYGTVDGEIFQRLSKQFFPNAKEVSLPNMTPTSQLFVDLQNGKYDFIFHDGLIFVDYDQNNKGGVVPLSEKPSLVTPVAIAVGLGETDFQHALNIALATLDAKGKLAAILASPPERAPYIPVPENWGY